MASCVHWSGRHSKRYQNLTVARWSLSPHGYKGYSLRSHTFRCAHHWFLFVQYFLHNNFWAPGYLHTVSAVFLTHHHSMGPDGVQPQSPFFDYSISFRSQWHQVLFGIWHLVVTFLIGFQIVILAFYLQADRKSGAWTPRRSQVARTPFPAPGGGLHCLSSASTSTSTPIHRWFWWVEPLAHRTGVPMTAPQDQ